MRDILPILKAPVRGLTERGPGVHFKMAQEERYEGEKEAGVRWRWRIGGGLGEGARVERGSMTGEDLVQDWG